VVQLAAMVERCDGAIGVLPALLHDLLQLDVSNVPNVSDVSDVPNVSDVSNVSNVSDVSNEPNVSAAPIVSNENVTFSDHNQDASETLLEVEPYDPADPIVIDDVDEADEDNDCFICLTRPNQVQLPCSHRLCGHCPARIHSQDPRCPYCRSPFNSFIILPGVDETEVIPLEDTASHNVQTRSFPIPNPFDLDDWETPVSTPVIHYTSINGVTTALREWGAPDWEGFVTCPYCRARIRNAPSRLVRHAHRCVHTRPDIHPNNLQ